jgi:MazG nucleotide pyrophosphohydrolase domain.
MNRSFTQLFEAQMFNQDIMLEKKMYENIIDKDNVSIPSDNIKLSSYHIQQLISEVGEVLEADKRWKNFRADKYNTNSKLEELADCFIVLMNISMFSGFDSEDVWNAINAKIIDVEKRIMKVGNNDNNS